MNFKMLITVLSAAALTACFPAKEISEENAESILAATTRINQITEKTGTGFGAQITPSSLERFMARTTTNVNDTCHNDEGSYLFSISETEASFSMAFDKCAGEDGGAIDGTVNGTFTETDNTYSVSMTGDLVASEDGESITFKPINFDLSVSGSTLVDLAITVSHGGTYTYDTDAYKGRVTVETIQPISFNIQTLEVTGIVKYTDGSGNTLRVEHETTGVYLYFNQQQAPFKVYTHTQWNQKF